MKKIVVLLVVLLGCMPVTAFAQKQFFFKDGRFVVAQFTDLHWMPGSAKCAETAATIRAVLAAEHPDIAILSGDVVTDDPAMDGWKSVVDIFNEARLRHTHSCPTAASGRLIPCSAIQSSSFSQRFQSQNAME